MVRIQFFIELRQGVVGFPGGEPEPTDDRPRSRGGSRLPYAASAFSAATSIRLRPPVFAEYSAVSARASRASASSSVR